MTATADTEQTIPIDKKHRLTISGQRWAIQKLLPSGDYDLVANGQGGGRTILRWCADNNVVPTRDADALLAALPDLGFRERN